MKFDRNECLCDTLISQLLPAVLMGPSVIQPAPDFEIGFWDRIGMFSLGSSVALASSIATFGAAVGTAVGAGVAAAFAAALAAGDAAVSVDVP
jgi:hypothetical protein